MKAIVQRVKNAHVTVDNTIISNIGEGLMVLLGMAGLPVKTGQFQANMDVSLINQGPVTLMLESR